MFIHLILIVYIAAFLKLFFSTPIQFDGEGALSIALLLVNIGLIYLTVSLSKRAKSQVQKYYWCVVMGLAFTWHLITFIRIEIGSAVEFEGLTYLMLPPFLLVAIGIASLFPSNNN